MKADQPDGLVTRAQLAAELDVQPNRINKWAADGMPIAVRGSRGHSAYYDPIAVRKWRAARERPDQDENKSLGASRARLANAQALKWERENRVREGQLLERSEIVAQGQTVMAAVKAKMLNLAEQAVLRGAIEREQKQKVHALVIEALRDLARLQSIGAEGDGQAKDAAGPEV